jgi:hypothetical protein
MIYSRNTYTTDNLTPDDFIHPLGWDYSLLGRYFSEKNTIRDMDSYYLFTFTAIDGTICQERFHPILGRRIINSEGEIGIIESLHKHWLAGNYWVILYRKEGTRSHGTLWLKNINSIDSIVIEAEIEFRRDWKFLDEYNLDLL